MVYQAERDQVDQQNQHAKSQIEKIETGLHGEKQSLEMNQPMSSGSEQLVMNSENEAFLQELDRQLEKVTKFFTAKEQEFLQDAQELRTEFNTFQIPLPESANATSFAETSALERLDSGLHQAPNSSVAGSDLSDDELSTSTAATAPAPVYSNAQLRYSTTDTLREQPNVMSSDDSDDSNNKKLSLPPLAEKFSSAYNAPTRSNTISAFNFRSRRASRIERTLSQHDAMPAYAEDVTAKPPTRIMQAIGLRFRRRRGSHVSMHQAENVNEFNQYYNFRVRCAATYISLTELKAYASTNRTCFDKSLKKWDKVTSSHLREVYFEKIVNSSDAFTPENFQRIDTALDQVLSMYAAVFTMGKKHNAEVELRMHMRDHIQFERNTVWKDLVGKERQQLDAHASLTQKGITIPKINVFVSRKTMFNIFGFLVSIIVYIILMCVDTMGQYEASKCLALLVFAALMWAFECIPLFATAFLIPLMVVPMHLVKDSEGNVLQASAAAKQVFAAMFSDTIMVLIGGFAIAAALSKHGIAKAFAATVLSKAGSRPRYLILVNMYLAFFLSMWISNVATPVLCFSLADPILRTLKPNSKVGPCLILAIALASCIGGLASPISSPQNIVTINLMDPNPGWGIWFAGAIPCGVITVLTTWLLLLLYFRPDRDTPHLNVIKSTGFSRPSWSQLWVCIVCLATIALWCAESSMNEFWGNNGVIAAIPFVLLFGTNMLSKSDLNNFLWSVVTLAQGGMALGFAVNSSGLLDVIGHQIASNVNGLSPLSIIFIFGMLVLVFATFVSHTVAALIILPIVKQVGSQLPVPRPNLMVMVAGLVSSVAMGLPVSG